MEEKEQIRVLVVDDVVETRENLRKLLSFAPDIAVVGAGSSGQEGIDLAREFRPDVILMDINMPGMDGIAATERILQEVPATQVVMLSVQGESDYLRRAMMAGARDFLTKPPSGDELMSTIRQVHESGKKRRKMLAPTQQAATVAAAHGGAQQRAGDIIVVFSPKGGVGCTTIAVNTSIALQQIAKNESKIALIDADLQFGDVGVMLDMTANRSIADLVTQIEDLDSDMLSSVLSPHPSGMKVLLAPPHPEAAEALVETVDGEMSSSAKIQAVLSLMRREFDIIVIDLWSRMDDIALTVFDMASMIVLVVMPSIPSIKSARLFLEVANKLGYPQDEIALVINGVDRHRAFRVDQIEQALLPVVTQIPLDEQAALGAANRGSPFFLTDPSRPIAQSIAQLAQHIKEKLDHAQRADEGAGKEAVAQGSGRLKVGRLF